MPSDEVLDIEQAAAFLQIGVQTLYGMARRHEVPARKVGGQWRFSRPALTAWLAGNGKPAQEGGKDA